MSDKGKKPTFKWLEKLKNVKHIEIYITVIFVAILLLIYFSNFSKEGETVNAKAVSASEMSVNQYVDNLEANLEEILSNIGGVSDVRVMITLEMGQAEVNDSKIELSSFPPVKGVIVTAKGVGDTYTKMKVLHAIESVIEVTNGNIQILSSD